MHNKQKNNFLSTTIMAHNLKSKTHFKKQVILDNISGLFYFDQFENILIRRRFDKLPENTKIIKFDDYFNESIDNLNYPKKVTHMIFGRDFNRSIIGCIPMTIKYLSFGYKFNNHIINAIPETVTHLKFGRHFNQPIEHPIPTSVKHLTLGKGFTYIGTNTLSELVNLQMHSYWMLRPIKFLPHNLAYLTDYYDGTALQIPPTVIHLHLRIYTSQHFPINMIPNSIKFLIINSRYDTLLTNRIPAGVERLRLEIVINQDQIQTFLESIPLSVKRLELCSHVYDKIIKFNNRQGLIIKRLK